MRKDGKEQAARPCPQPCEQQAPDKREDECHEVEIHTTIGDSQPVPQSECYGRKESPPAQVGTQDTAASTERTIQQGEDRSRGTGPSERMATLRILHWVIR